MSENTTVEQRLNRIEQLLRGQKTVLNFAEACEFTGLSKQSKSRQNCRRESCTTEYRSPSNRKEYSGR